MKQDKELSACIVCRRTVANVTINFVYDKHKGLGAPRDVEEVEVVVAQGIEDVRDEQVATLEGIGRNIT